MEKHEINKTKTCICNYVLIIDNYHNFEEEEIQKSIQNNFKKKSLQNTRKISEKWLFIESPKGNYR